MATMIWFSVFKANCHLSKLFRASGIPSAIQERTSGIRSCTQSWWQGIRLHWEIILSAPCVPNQFFVVQFPSFKSPCYPSSKVFLSATRARLLLLCKQGPIKSIIRPWTIEDPLSIQSLLSKVLWFLFLPFRSLTFKHGQSKVWNFEGVTFFSKETYVFVVYWPNFLNVSSQIMAPAIYLCWTLWGCLTMPATAPLGLRWSANARKIVWNDLDLEINTHPIPNTHGLITENSWII